MGTYPQIPSPETQHDANRLIEAREKFVGSLHDLTESPPGDEQVLTAFGVAAIDVLTDSEVGLPPIQGMVDRFMMKRPDMTPEQQVQLFWRQIQFHRGPLDPEYPYAFEDPARWYGMLKGLSEDRAAMDRIDHQLGYFSVQTNEPKRHVGLLLAMKLHEDQLPREGASVVDWGCSVGLVMMQMKTNRLPHRPEVASVDIKGNKLDPAFQRGFEAIFAGYAGRVALGECWGVDLADHDQATMGWAVPGCQYPSEYGDLERREQLAKLTSLRLVQLRNLGLRFFQGDFTDEEDMSMFDIETGFHRFDVSWQSTVLYQYQGKPKELEAALHNERQVLKDNALEVIQDFATPWNNGQQLRFTPLYGKGSQYNLMVRNLADQEPRLETLGRFSNGRCEVFFPGSAAVHRLVAAGLA
ncbi:MAG: hypothetical protein JWM37_716 [Candidatus Saccharibacteria bacterium]|nr:hypothetical protein [Candidatus Saccharibacteria bacterium]